MTRSSALSTRTKLKHGLPKTLYKNKLSKAQIQKFMLIWPSILVLLGLVAYPLGTVLLQSLLPKLMDQGFTQFSLQSFSVIFNDNYTYRSIIYALVLGGGTAVLASIIGTFLAVLVYRNKIHGERFVALFIWLVFFTPSYLIAEGWVLMMQRKGLLSELLGIPDGGLDWFFSLAGLIAAMAFRLFPVIYFSVLAGLRGLGPEYEEAARTLGARSFLVWIKINLPLLFPSILAGATLAFAESVSDFGFAAALVPQAHIPLLSYSIYTALNQSPPNFSQVGVLSIILIGVIGLAIWSQKWILGKGSYSTIKNQIRPYRLTHRKPIILSIIAYLFLSIALFVPLSGEIISSLMKNTNSGFIASNFTLQNYINAIQIGSESYQAVKRSLLLSMGTAVIVSILGVGLAFVIQRGQGYSTRILYVLTMSTIAIPGIVLAAGYVFAWNAPYLVPMHLNLYGTLFCVFLAYIAGSLPYSIRLQIGAITQLSPSLLSSGQVHGAGIYTLFRKILIPLVSGTVVATLFLTFSHLMFELPVSELLHPPAEQLLPVEISHFYNELMVEKGSSLTVLGIVLVLIVYGVGQLLIYVIQKIKQMNSKRLVQDVVSIKLQSEVQMSVPTRAIQQDIERQVT
ncbi:iron ABC transporter permease [Paenibacillus filicis]|uniref:Iron ABC transporter permease n=1 Tax=Paenibacillus gyeongsangnamensis TaxID=3388067 RepID=A0ABT4Q5S7_9BACL|nr:iron ABC transporter permease [Paenibacillus filicis]MCZ8512151.1 iron ABC transporter permease [Paenibacillus filicis]